MHGLSAAIGPTAHSAKFACTQGAEIQRVSAPGFAVERQSPAGQPLPAWQGASRSGSLHVYIDGELLVRSLAVDLGQREHISAFAETLETAGVDTAIDNLVGGSFIAVVVDSTGRAMILRDPLGTIPAYEAHAGPDWLVSTNPVCLARCSGVDDTPDRNALASLALVGYTIGTRYFVRGIRTLKAGAWYAREPDGRVATLPLRFDPFNRIPDSGDSTSTAELAAAVESACRRLADTRVPTAHMQSGGMDSRLLLAAWPAASPISCYSYGDPRSGEVTIAREIARLRGTPHCHLQPTGREVAQILDDMFGASGLMVYPARWFLAERMAADGHRRVLDGFAGGFLLGGAFYVPKLTLAGVIDKLTARYRETLISKVGLEALAADVYAAVCEVPEPGKLAGWLDPAFVDELENAGREITADIYDELARLRPANDSMPLLVRNFLIANRSVHAILQQGVMSRHAVNVAYPFAADYDFLKRVLAIPLSRLAWRRLQIAVFRAHFPSYAEGRYAVSMLPVRRAAASHQVAIVLSNRGVRIPGITGPRTRTPNNWARWLRESPELRERLAAALQAGGIGSSALDARLSELADGTARGSGKLLHLASIGRWLGGVSQGKP
jgi:asparagine synthetase B (glutamine-hydrolysing)